MQKRSESEARGNHLTDKQFRLTRESMRWVWAISVFILVFAVFFVSLVPQRIHLTAGEVSPIDVKAPQEVIDEAATERLKEERAKTVPKVFDSDPKVLSDIKGKILSFRGKLAEAADTPNTSTQDIIRGIRPFLSADASDLDIVATAAASPQTLDLACSRLDQVLTDVLTQGVSPENLDKARTEVSASITRDKTIPDQVGRVLVAFINLNLKPNLTFNQEETDKRVKEAQALVEPVRIRRGQFIVREGDVVTEDQIAILAELGMIGSRIRFSAVAGAAMMAVLFCGLLAIYLRIYHVEALSAEKIGLISSVTVLGIVAIKTISAVSPYLAPTAYGVMLAATLFDRKFGIFLGTGLTLVAATVNGFEASLVLLFLVGGLAAALAIEPDWNRVHLLRAGMIVCGAQALTYLALGLTGAIPISDLKIWKNTLLLLANGPISAVLAVGSLPLFEAAFGIITPLRLIELSNPESPLLHRLLLEAPGTYHHSIMVGNLAEAAAMAIGADSLLARVGAYYHDVGKIKRPYFFAENQVPGVDNPHDKMSPTLSAAVITSHVKDGLELAAGNRVPQVIRDFIAQHHGTMLASFFYAKASEKETKDNRVPDEVDFRYEGPRPDSKETAVVMLADGVEAATRALSKPTPARIESVVRKIIQDRLLDHQLDRSELTLRDLDTVADTFTKVLTGVFHTRIEYPDRVPVAERGANGGN